MFYGVSHAVASDRLSLSFLYSIGYARVPLITEAIQFVALIGFYEYVSTRS